MSLWLAGVSAAHPSFNKDWLDKLTFLHERGAERVQLHVVARPGRNAELAAALERRGAQIRFRADDIDYLRVAMPIANVDDINTLPAVEAATLSLSGQRWDPTAQGVLPPMQEGPEPPTPLLSPYRAITDMSGLDWQRQNPTFDGRGTAIAMLDEIPDLLHPDLQKSLDLRGHPVPKLLDIQYTGNARDDITDTRWVRVWTDVHSQNRRFIYDGREYIAPHDGTYRFGLVPRPAAGGIQLPVAAATGGDPSKLPILWERRTGTVWVDTNVDGSFADEKPMQPYEKRRDIGVFGRDDPATPIRETVGFTISIDQESQTVRLNLGWAPHGTGVAGAAVASGMNGGAFDAVAGQAQLAEYQTSDAEDAYNVPETVYRAMQDPRIDVLFYEWNARQFFDYSLRDGGNALSIALDRIAARFRKPIFVPAHNFQGMSLVAELSVPEHLISVSAYDSSDAVRTNYGVTSPYHDDLHVAEAFGPAGNGALKPDLLAPASPISTNMGLTSPMPRRLKGYFNLPPFYMVCGGTSCATPVAAAATALLISAAKQKGVKWDAARLRYALFSTARFLQDIPAYQQGRGLIQIDSAWQALVALDHVKGWQAPRIEVDAPVRTSVSHLLPTSDHGVGLFEREGWRAHQRGERQIVFTRRNGPSTPVTYQLQWQGDTAAFSSATTITLPLNQPVALPIAIVTGEARAYSALLRLRESGMPVESLSLLATVVAADAPAAATQDTLKKTLSIRRPGVESVFVYVPPGTQALYVTAAKQSPEKINVSLLPPDADRLIPNAMTLSKGVAHKAVQEPAPGVWEVLIFNRNLLRDFGKDQLEPRPDPLTPTAVDLEVKWVRTENGGAPASSQVLWSSPGSELEKSVMLHGRQVFRLTVPKGTRLLKAQLDHIDDPTAEVTLLAYQVKDGQPVENQKVRSMGGIGPVVRINNPAPGEWRIVVEPCHLSTPEAHAIYRDLLVQPDAVSALPGRRQVEVNAFGLEGEPFMESITQPLARADVPGFTYDKSLAGIAEYTLDSNGLDVLLKPDPSAPVVTFQVTYHVGSRNEVTGTTGATHLLEHLMYKGSEHFNDPSGNSVKQYLERVGGQYNAATSFDRTNYFATLGRDNLEGYIAIEADRMRNLWLHAADLQAEMTVVRNEYERGENNPGNTLMKEVFASAFEAQPYHHMTIGWRSDIENVPLEKLREFYDTFYWPDNSTVTVVGAFDPAHVLGLIKKYYGAIPHSPRPIPQPYTTEPPQQGPRRVVLKRPGQLGTVMIAYKGPNGRDEDIPALDVLGAILSKGENSRLSKALMDKSLTTRVSAEIELMHDPGLFLVSAGLAPEAKHEQVEATLLAEIGKVKNQGVTVEEVSRVVHQFRASEAYNRDGTTRIAAQINDWIGVGDWTLYATYVDKVAKVTPTDVLRVANEYFSEDRSTTGWFVPVVTAK